MSDTNVCGCKKAVASPVDNLCRYCREHLVSRAEAKKLGVLRRGDGMTLEQYSKSRRHQYEFPTGV